MDAYAASHRAVREMKADGELPGRVKLRSSQYLNNLVEQDHRRVKQPIRAATLQHPRRSILQAPEQLPHLHPQGLGQQQQAADGQIHLPTLKRPDLRSGAASLLFLRTVFAQLSKHAP